MIMQPTYGKSVCYCQTGLFLKGRTLPKTNYYYYFQNEVQIILVKCYSLTISMALALLAKGPTEVHNLNCGISAHQ